MLATVDWNAVSAIATATASVLAVIGLILTGIGSIATAAQLRVSRLVARAQFELNFYELIQQHNDVHVRLMGEGWPNGRKGPESPAEWNSVKRYMGLLESLPRLVECGLMSLDQVDESFSHRVFLLVNNAVIHEKCLVQKAFAWKRFITLARSLQSHEVYQGLVKEEQSKAGASTNA